VQTRRQADGVRDEVVTVAVAAAVDEDGAGLGVAAMIRQTLNG
jgi:hypothetical protein